MAKGPTVTTGSVRAANGRIVSRDSRTGEFVPARSGWSSTTLVDERRVSEVGRRSLPVPVPQKKK